MLELPEATTLAKQLRCALAGRTVDRVLPPTKPHAFCWFNGDPSAYDAGIAGSVLVSAESFGMFVELGFDNGHKLCFHDGVNPRLVQRDCLPKDYQLAICLRGGDALVFTVAMYGGLYLHGDDWRNEYYEKSRQAVTPFSPAFDKRFYEVLAASKPPLRMKGFVATEQRFPGIGNGVTQDILFNARLHPKRKLSTLDEGEVCALLESMKNTLGEMVSGGGRDTEKDLYGKPGGYATKMSKKTLAAGCPVCGGAITKEAYLGGSVYYCAQCQPLQG